jgi:hypothetical protein
MADTPAARRPAATPSPAAVRLMLVADRDHRRGAPADSRVRRFRLARVPARTEDRPGGLAALRRDPR